MGITATAEAEMFAGRSKTHPECEAFLRDNLGLLYRVAASYEAHPTIREDLLQEIVLAIWKASSRFESRSSFKTFALRVAHNRAITHCTRESRKKPTVELKEDELHTHLGSEGGPEEATERALQQESLLAAVRQLPVAQRQILGLALEGMSYEEIAAVLDITTNNVGVRLNRAKKSLAEVLND